LDDEINLELGNDLEEQVEEADDKDSLAQNDAGVGTKLHEAYIGAELYNKRMFPQGCPSYQKAFVKLYRVEQGTGKNKVLRMLSTQFFSNRDGFGYVNRNLKPGEYQIQFKKYSSAFDVFDFTVKVFSDIDLSLVDEEEHEIQKVKISDEQMKNIPKIGEEAAEEKKEIIDSAKTKASGATPPAPVPVKSDADKKQDEAKKEIDKKLAESKQEDEAIKQEAIKKIEAEEKGKDDAKAAKKKAKEDAEKAENEDPKEPKVKVPKSTGAKSIAE
jgi:hypothetical protein